MGTNYEYENEDGPKNPSSNLKKPVRLGVDSLDLDRLGNQCLQDLQVSIDAFKLEDTTEAITFAARLTAFVLREMHRGSSIIVQHKSGAKSKMIVKMYGG